MRKDVQEKDYNGITQGVIWQQLLIFFFPLLFGTFFQMLYNTTDAVIVGRFVGTVALSAIGGAGLDSLRPRRCRLCVAMASGGPDYITG